VAYGDIIQNKDGESYDTSVTVTLDSTPTEGNLLVASHYTGAPDSSAPAGFSEAVALTHVDDEGAIYYKVAGAGESTSITAGASTTKNNMLNVLEIEGPWNATPLDQTASDGPNYSVSSQTSGTTSTTSQADEFAVALITVDDVGKTLSGWTNSFVERSDNGGPIYKFAAVATRLLTSTGAYETTATISASSYAAVGGIATFKKSAAGGAVGAIPVFMHHYRQQGMI